MNPQEELKTLQKCENCLYEVNGLCHYYPPSVVPVAGTDFTMRPNIKGDKGCSKYNYKYTINGF